MLGTTAEVDFAGAEYTLWILRPTMRLRVLEMTCHKGLRYFELRAAA